MWICCIFSYFTDAQFSEADLARSLLFTISNDVGQVASLYAMMHKLNKVGQPVNNYTVLR
jgi:pantothenate kinase